MGLIPFQLNGLMDNWKLMVSKAKGIFTHDLSDDNLELLKNFSNKISTSILSRCYRFY